MVCSLSVVKQDSIANRCIRIFVSGRGNCCKYRLRYFNLYINVKYIALVLNCSYMAHVVNVVNSSCKIKGSNYILQDLISKWHTDLTHL